MDITLEQIADYLSKFVDYINQCVPDSLEKENSITIGEDRVLHYNQMSVHNELDNVLYDLIKDGLVEKVD